MKKNLPVYIAIVITVVLLIFFSIRYALDTSAISKLQVSIKDIQLQEVQVTYTKLKFNIEISNPTDEDINELSSDFNIFIAGVSIGKGNIPLMNIPAQTVKETNTTIKIYYANVANAVIDALANQNFKLTIRGTLNAKVLFGLLSLSQDFSSTYSYS